MRVRVESLRGTHDRCVTVQRGIKAFTAAWYFPVYFIIIQSASPPELDIIETSIKPLISAYHALFDKTIQVGDSRNNQRKEHGVTRTFAQGTPPRNLEVYPCSESKVETINVPERFRAAAIHLEKECVERECVERECVEGPRVHVYPWEINPLTAYKEAKENEWMPWVVEIIFAAMQLPNIVEAKIGDEKYSSNSRKSFETR
jgi:hypothetical protein